VPSGSMQPNTPDLERPMLRMGSVAFLAGLVIAVVSTWIHPSGEDLMDNPVTFPVYAEDDLWIASHIGQFAGGMLIFVGGFVALHRLLARSESGTTASALAWLGLVAAIVTASTFTILQAVDGIALKILGILLFLLLLLLPLLLIVKKKKQSPFELQKGLGGLSGVSKLITECFKGWLH
jgi:hypothetical protein